MEIQKYQVEIRKYLVEIQEYQVEIRKYLVVPREIQEYKNNNRNTEISRKYFHTRTKIWPLLTPPSSSSASITSPSSLLPLEADRLLRSIVREEIARAYPPPPSSEPEASATSDPTVTSPGGQSCVHVRLTSL